MRLSLFVFCLIAFPNIVLSQLSKPKEKNKFVSTSVFAGISYRVTPIDITHYPSNSFGSYYIPYHNRDNQLSGFNYHLSVAFTLNKIDVGILAEATLRYKQLYYESPILYDTNTITIGRAVYGIVSDYEIGFFKNFTFKNGIKLRVVLGTSSMNNGTSYVINSSYRTAYGMFYIRDETNFKFAATYGSIGFQRKKVLYELRAYYSNSQHNFIGFKNFLIPELKINYQIF